MTHEDAGNYAAKRPDTVLNEAIASALKEKAAENRISCGQAHAIAAKLGVSPADVGAAIDLLELRINKCQLGLFGYESKTNIPEISGPPEPGIESEIRTAAINGRLSCADAWEIAKKYSIPKAKVTAICETVDVKINKCQLGTFK